MHCPPPKDAAVGAFSERMRLTAAQAHAVVYEIRTWSDGYPRDSEPHEQPVAAVKKFPQPRDG